MHTPRSKSTLSHGHSCLCLYVLVCACRYTPFDMSRRRQRLDASQDRNNAEIKEYFSKLVHNHGNNPAFTLTIYGLKRPYVIRHAAWTGNGSSSLEMCPIRDQLLDVFEQEVRPRHNCADDDARTACNSFWSFLSIDSRTPQLFRGCAWRYEDASGNVLQKK